LDRSEPGRMDATSPWRGAYAEKLMGDSAASGGQAGRMDLSAERGKNPGEPQPGGYCNVSDDAGHGGEWSGTRANRWEGAPETLCNQAVWPVIFDITGPICARATFY